MNNSHTKSLLTKADWIVLALIIFIPRLLNLNVFLTPDEPLFFEHAQGFAQGIVTGDFTQTLGIGYPGVTVAAIAALPVWLVEDIFKAAIAGRIAVTLLNGTLLLILYGLSHRLLGRWPAFIGITLLALAPLFLAYSRLLHNEALLTIFMTLSGISLLLWLRDKRFRYLIYTGIFIGLSLLTKSTALVLGPMLIVMVTSWAIGTNCWRSWYWWLRVIKGGVIALGIAIATFFLLWPAMWTQPVTALNLTFTKLFTDQEAGIGNLGFFWMGQFVQNPGPTFYPIIILLKTTPWLLAGIALSLGQVVAPIFKRQKPSKPWAETFTLWLFSFTYLFLMTVASKKAIRYLLPAIPTFYLLAGVAFYQSGKWLNQTIQNWQSAKSNDGATNNKNRTATLTRIFLLLLLTAIITFTSVYHPYYLTYNNPVLFGWKWAPKIVLLGWGEGLDKAAAYLNNQPNGVVAAWYPHLFQFFYPGQVQDITPTNLLTADYSVIYLSQVQRDIPNPNIIHYFRTRRMPEHTVRLNGIDYAWVYPGPIAGFETNPTPKFPTGGNFGNETQLLGYNLHPQPAISSDPLIVTLFWRVLSMPPDERFVYLRLVDESGHVWAKADSPPVMGLWPVSQWQPDMLIEDAHELPIPPGTPPGAYRLEVGLYNPDSGETVPASGQPLGQGGGLLLGEVEVNWQSTSQAGLELANQISVNLSPNVKLTGHSNPPQTATTGDLLPLSLAWQNSDSLFRFSTPLESKIVFNWQPSTEPVEVEPVEVEQVEAGQIDTFPLPVAEWGRGAALLSQHDVIVPPHLETGQYNLFLSLRNGDTPAGESIKLGSVQVTAPAHQFDLPPNAQTPDEPAQLGSDAGQKVSLAGYTLNNDDGALVANLYWKTSQPLTAGYKVFAQLLAADNTVVAQSDAIPAAGLRPTPGWLSDEIIIDTHRLTPLVDLPAGSYRLITGLYNPATGQRLPLLNEAGEPIGDSIFVTEVNLP